MTYPEIVRGNDLGDFCDLIRRKSDEDFARIFGAMPDGPGSCPSGGAVPSPAKPSIPIAIKDDQ